jgi:hypothetical protein
MPSHWLSGGKSGCTGQELGFVGSPKFSVWGSTYNGGLIQFTVSSSLLCLVPAPSTS